MQLSSLSRQLYKHATIAIDKSADAMIFIQRRVAVIMFSAARNTMHDAQVLAEKLAEGLPIRHGMTVDGIQWNSRGVIVQCQGGQQIEADAVIVTVSLGVLKVHSSSCACLLHFITLHFFPDVALALALETTFIRLMLSMCMQYPVHITELTTVVQDVSNNMPAPPNPRTQNNVYAAGSA